MAKPKNDANQNGWLVATVRSMKLYYLTMASSDSVTMSPKFEDAVEFETADDARQAISRLPKSALCRVVRKPSA
jgi:hypothetical protein